MKREEKIEMIQEIIEKKDPYIGLYAELLLSMGDMKLNYRDYMITEPINCSEELKRVFNADYDLCAALLTMVLREDHFSNGSFKRRFAAGQVLPILKRMMDVLSIDVIKKIIKKIDSYLYELRLMNTLKAQAEEIILAELIND